MATQSSTTGMKRTLGLTGSYRQRDGAHRARRVPMDDLPTSGRQHGYSWQQYGKGYVDRYSRRIDRGFFDSLCVC